MKEKIESKARELIDQYFSKVEQVAYTALSSDTTLAMIATMNKAMHNKGVPSDEEIKQYQTKNIRKKSEILVDTFALNDDYFDKFEQKLLEGKKSDKKSFMHSALNYKLLSELEKLEISQKQDQKVEKIVGEINKIIKQLNEYENPKNLNDSDQKNQNNNEVKIVNPPTNNSQFR